MVFPVYGSNLEDLSKLNVFENGFGNSIVKKFTRQTLENLSVLHYKNNLIHCDIKPDNFLLSYPDYHIREIMNCYQKNKFIKIYNEILRKNPEIKTNKIKNTQVREKIHCELIKEIDFETILQTKISDDELLNQLKNSDFLLSDFGSFCDIEEKYDEDFGTRYYRAPENILVSEELDYSTDIWSLGCTIYELLTNEILFDPSKCKNYSTNHYHLSEIFQLGKLSNKEIKTLQKKKEFFNKDRTLKKLPTSDVSIVDKINQINDSFWKGLVLSMLTVSFKKRPTSKSLLLQII